MINHNSLYDNGEHVLVNIMYSKQFHTDIYIEIKRCDLKLHCSVKGYSIISKHLVNNKYICRYVAAHIIINDD